MKTKMKIKEQVEKLNNLCVKTYLEILGYSGVTISGRGLTIFASPFDEVGRLYVDLDSNRFRLSHGKFTGGVLDLACALFGETGNNIIRNIALYRIDLLMTKCGSRSGAIR
jgi:hypothetical protein